MYRLSCTATVLGLSLALAAVAHAQSGPAGTVNTGTPSSPIARNPKGMVAPFNETAEEAWVKEHVRAAGYSGVNSLVRDDGGTWHARAYKGPADVIVVIDRSGAISESGH